MKRITEAVLVTMACGVITAILSLFTDVQKVNANQHSITEKLDYIHKDIIYLRKRLDRLYRE